MDSISHVVTSADAFVRHMVLDMIQQAGRHLVGFTKRTGPEIGHTVSGGSRISTTSTLHKFKKNPCNIQEITKF